MRKLRIQISVFTNGVLKMKLPTNYKPSPSPLAASTFFWSASLRLSLSRMLCLYLFSHDHPPRCTDNTLLITVNVPLQIRLKSCTSYLVWYNAPCKRTLSACTCSTRYGRYTRAYNVFPSSVAAVKHMSNVVMQIALHPRSDTDICRTVLF